MKQETRYFEAFPGAHHYTILSESEVKELLRYGIICTILDKEDSYYIVTEEEWDRCFKEGE